MLGGIGNAACPNPAKPVTISGNPGDDAQHYQVRAVRLAMAESKA